MKIGTNDIVDCKIGTTQVNKVYLGSNLVWEFGGSYDADAQAFLTATGITDLTISNAINQLVIDLKGFSLWSDLLCIYPMVGGNATTHSYNLKNPATYQITFNGGWTHASTGALPNGTNGYADTGFIPDGILGQNDASISYYSRTLNTSTPDKVVMGSFGSNGQSTLMGSISTQIYWGLNNNNFPLLSVSGSNGAYGLTTATITATTTSALFQKTTKTSVTNASTGVSNRSIILGANNATVAQQFSSFECAFAHIGLGLNDTKCLNLETAVQSFQTALSRNV